MVQISEREDRIKKLQELRDKNIDPYPAKSDRDTKIDSVFVNFNELEKNKKELVIAGRLRSKREHGNLIFCHLEDERGRMQIAISKKDIGEEKFKNFKKIVSDAKVQTIISLGDQEISELLLKYYQNGANYSALKRAEEQTNISVDEYLLKIKEGYSPWRM